MNSKSLILLFTIVTSYSVLALLNTNQNIYPVAGEIFQMGLGEFFAIDGLASSVQVTNPSVGSTLFPFTVTNYGTVVDNNVTINGTIISTAEASQYGNPNIPNNRYAYLVEVFNGSNSSQFVGYQLYEGILQSNGQINPVAKSSLFNPPETTCYTAEYISSPQHQNSLIAAVCVTDDVTQIGYSDIMMYYYFPYHGLTNVPFYMADTSGDNNFNRSQIESVQTQITVSSYGSTYLSMLFIMNGGNYLQIYEVQPMANNVPPTLYFIQDSNSDTYNILSFYLATDLSLFLLQNNSTNTQIEVLNATSYSQLGLFYLPYNTYTNLGVYQTATNTVEQLFYVAAVSPATVSYYEYSYNGSEYILTQNNDYANPSVNQIISIFVTPDVTVLVSSDQSFALPGPIWTNPYLTFGYIWSQTLNNNQATTVAASFDDYNDVLVWSLNNGTILTVQFKEQTLVSTQPLNTSVANGSFSLVGTTQYGPITYNFNYYIVANSSWAAAYEIQLPKEEYLNSYYEPSLYFTGPNLQYSSSFSYATNNDQSYLYQWENVYFVPNLTNCTFIQNFINQNDSLLVQIYQINNNGSIETFLQNCYSYYCLPPGNFTSSINQQIQQIFTSNYSTYVEIVAIQYQSSSIIEVYQTSDITDIDQWYFLASVNVADYFPSGLIPSVKSLAVIYNNLYVVTSNPASLIAFQIGTYSYNQVYLIASTQLDNYAPQNIWANELDYGELIFIDNVYELVILQLVDETFFVEINTIPYPIENYNSVIFSNLGYGFFLTFQTNTGSNIFFYPYTNLQTVNFNSKGYTTTPGTFNYTISSTVFAASQNYQYFVDNQTLLVYQYAESSVGSLYTTYTFSSNITSVQAVSVPAEYFDIITVILNGTTSQTVMLYYYPVLINNVQINNQYLVQDGTLSLIVNSNGQLNQVFNFTTTVVGNLQNNTIIANSSVTGKQLQLNDSSQNNVSFTWVYPYYPYPDFLGPIDSLSAVYSNLSQFNSTPTLQLNSSMVQLYNNVSITNSQAFTYCPQEGVIAQNLTGSYILNSKNLTQVTSSPLFIFPTSDSVTSCPFVGEYNSTQFLSVCTLSNSTTVLYTYTTKSNQSIQLTGVTGTIVSAFYQNGIFTLSSQTNAFVCALNLETKQQVYCQSAFSFAQSVTNTESIEIISISSPNKTSNLTQSFGILVPQNQYVQFYTIGVLDQTNLTNNTNLTVSFTATNATSYLNSQIQQIYVTNTNYTQYTYYQIVQTSNATLVNGLIQVPIFQASSEGNFGFNLNFNVSDILIPNLVSTVLQCGYGAYPVGTFSGLTAVNDLVVSSYTQGTSITYISYRSSNSLFGGNGPVCTPSGNNIQMVYHLGATTYNTLLGLKASNSYPLLNVLPNGQVFTTNGQSTQLIQLLSAYQFSGQVPLANYNDTIPIQLTASNLDSTVSNTFSLKVQQYIPPAPVPTPSTNDTDNNLVWIIIGSCIGGLIVIGLIGWLICRNKNGNSYNEQQLQASRNIEL